MEPIAIVCRGVKKSYGTGDEQVEVLKNIDLEILRGQLTLLVGPSGSGKTTLVSIIATLLTADGGEVFLLDREVGAMTELEKAEVRSKSIGIVFQSLFLIPTLTVAENVALPLIVGGMDEKKALERAIPLLESVHLAHRSHVSPKLLSKGQQQRVAISRAMVNDAEILIFDEPTSALDHVAGFEIMEFLRQLAKNSTKAILVVTHDPRIFPYADTIITMSDGEIVR